MTESFSWENRYQQSWEFLEEDEQGKLKEDVSYYGRHFLINAEYLKKRKDAADRALRRSVMRNLVLLIDWSIATADTDITPYRGYWLIKNVLEAFISEFIEQNPLSQLGLVIMKDGLAQIISPLSSSFLDHISYLLQLLGDDSKTPSGILSLQNGLMVAESVLAHVPKHSSREVLVMQIGLATLDSEDLISIIPRLVKDKIRISFVSLFSEVAVCKNIASKTGGTYYVSIDDIHFSELVKDHIKPPPSLLVKGGGRLGSYSIKMGFPETIVEKRGTLEPLCACHTEQRSKGFICPQCSAFVCQVPIDCPICGLTLILAPHLTKSYHYLFSPPVYEDENRKIESLLGSECSGCGTSVQLNEVRMSSMERHYKAGQCRKCGFLYCACCNELVHEQLFNCPTCT